MKKFHKLLPTAEHFFKGEYSFFFALIGPRNNGHFYIPNLIKKGISTFVVSDKTVIQPEASFILVENTTAAIQKLAAFIRINKIIPLLELPAATEKRL